MPAWTAEELTEVAAMEPEQFRAMYPHRSRAAISSQRNRLHLQGVPVLNHPRRVNVEAAVAPVVEQQRALREMHRQADRNLGMTGAMQTVVAEPDDEQYERLLRLFEEIDDSVAALSPTQESTEFRAPDDGLPIGIAFSGDWHLGASGIESERLRADLKLIGTTDGLYVAGMGDYVEGVGIYNKAASALYEGLFNDGDLQEAASITYFRYADGKWIAVGEGNHDAWMRRSAGVSRLSRILRQLGVRGQRPPYFSQGGGTIFAHVGHQRYVIAIVHNATGNSRLNTTNAQRRVFDSWPQWEGCDVICCGHLHFNDLHIQSRKGSRCLYLRSGTAKTRDSYAADHGFRPEYGIPLTILLPDEKRVLAFRGDDFRLGVDYLTWLREQYRARRKSA